jgi:hypothetical protein
VTQVDADVDDETRTERWFRCARCLGRVAPERAAIAISGAHEHGFMNPAGVHFRVACFETAPGCISDGPRSDVWTWFPGHAWQVELCRGCGRHLGWSFHGAAHFYGLVRDWLL